MLVQVQFVYPSYQESRPFSYHCETKIKVSNCSVLKAIIARSDCPRESWCLFRAELVIQKHVYCRSVAMVSNFDLWDFARTLPTNARRAPNNSREQLYIAMPAVVEGERESDPKPDRGTDTAIEEVQR